MSSAPPRSIRLDGWLRTAWRMVRGHPVVSAALGGAIVLSLASTLFGIGVLTTPWFVCELFALQLGVLIGRPPARTGAWARAGLLTLCLVGLVALATWLAALAIGPDVSTADSAAAPLPWPEALERVGLIAAVTALTVGFIAPFAYAPLILIDRGGRIGEAVLGSAWLVRRGGLFRHWALVFLAHLLPLAPAIVLAVAVARTFERAATPIGFLLGLPLLPLSIPLGQGLLSAAYVERRAELPDRRWHRREGNAPLALRVILIAVVLAPMASVLLLAIGALRPSLPRPGEGTGALMVERAIEQEDTVFIADTTLAVAIAGRTAEVRAGGLAVLRFTRRWPIARVRVRRHAGVYDIVFSDRAGSAVISVDRAGVRVDDSIADRLARRLPRWALPAIALAFALSALLFARALEPLGGLRRAYGVPAHERAPLALLRADRARALRAAWIIALVLLPTSALALAGGLCAVIG